MDLPVKKWYQSKIMWIGLITVLSGGVGAYLSMTSTGELASVLVIIQGVLVAFLRYNSNTVLE